MLISSLCTLNRVRQLSFFQNDFSYVSNAQYDVATVLDNAQVYRTIQKLVFSNQNAFTAKKSGHFSRRAILLMTTCISTIMSVSSSKTNLPRLKNGASLRNPQLFCHSVPFFLSLLWFPVQLAIFFDKLRAVFSYVKIQPFLIVSGLGAKSLHPYASQ